MCPKGLQGRSTAGSGGLSCFREGRMVSWFTMLPLLLGAVFLVLWFVSTNDDR